MAKCSLWYGGNFLPRFGFRQIGTIISVSFIVLALIVKCFQQKLSEVSSSILDKIQDADFEGVCGLFRHRCIMERG